ncbi:hypothetical protein NW762_013309 [Fusarium torreyae]|uniref:Uncharacterized protein n=1 Tax=Fusarium torreyae TaxID=1237075 RepID=A0A9W8RNY2_9HYPO|nr:hypothetical protein NW762_013309 [Fusarium torreyae]
MDVDEWQFEPSDFQEEINKSRNGFKRKRRELVVERVLSAFEAIKGKMAPRALNEIWQYLRNGKWVKDCANASGHPAYKEIKGRGSLQDPERLYFPDFFVLRSIWPTKRSVIQISFAFGKYWGVGRGRWDYPDFYPELGDHERELRLFRFEESKEQPQNHHPDDGSDSESRDSESEDTETKDKDLQQYADESDEEEEATCDERVKTLEAQLQEAKEERRTTLSRKRAYYEEKSKYYAKKKREYRQKLEDD